MDMGTRGALLEFNTIYKENDEIYRAAARTLGLSDTAFWILYLLRETEGAYTQQELSMALSLPKQTINSALKKLEQEGILTLHPMSDKRSKRVHLTVRGRHFASRTVDLVLEMECESMGQLSARERETLLHLYKKYTGLLASNMDRLADLLEKEKEKKQNYAD